MKIYVKASVPTDVMTITLNIDVYHEVAANIAAAFSEIKPVYDENGELDMQALADYDCFVEDVLGELWYYGFQIMRASESQSSKTSKYYTLANEDQVKANDIKYLIFLRISEHHSMLDEEQKAWVRKEREKDLQKFKQPATKPKQKFKVREILVDKDSYPSYDAAMEEVVSRIREWANAVK